MKASTCTTSFFYFKYSNFCFFAACNMSSTCTRLWIVTSGAQYVGVETNASKRMNPQQSAVWGLCKVISIENPELKCSRVDIEPEYFYPSLNSSIEDENLKWEAMCWHLHKEFTSDDREDQIAIRNNYRYALRISKSNILQQSPRPLVRLKPLGDDPSLSVTIQASW